MKSFVERMVEEQKNLNEKINKLFNFLCSRDFGKLSIDNQVLLRLQYLSMTSYNDILIKRIGINK